MLIRIWTIRTISNKTVSVSAGRNGQKSFLQQLFTNYVYLHSMALVGKRAPLSTSQNAGFLFVSIEA